MQKANDDKKYMRIFWEKHKDRCMLIRSIDSIYDEYLAYLKEIGIDRAINRYIFRTYLRKSGYNNSGVEMKLPVKKIKKKNIDKLLKKAEQNSNALKENQNGDKQQTEQNNNKTPPDNQKIEKISN